MKDKKVLIIGIAVLFVLIVAGALIYMFKSDDSKDFSSSSKGKITEIDYDEFVDLVESNKRFIIIFTQDGCPHCKKMLETLKDVVAKKGIEIYNYDVKSVNEEQAEYIRELTSLKTVPLLVVFDKGEVLEDYKITGVKDYDEIIDFLDELEEENSSEEEDKKSDSKKDKEEKEDKSEKKKDNDKTDSKNFEKKAVADMKKCGKNFYEDFYYDSIDVTADATEFLSKYKEIGIKVDIENLTRYDCKVDLSYISGSCNLKNTKIIIYPNDPYGKTDYEMNVELDCDN